MSDDPKYTTGEYYHVFNKTIDGLKVFRNRADCARFLELVAYYKHRSPPCAYSHLLAFAERSKSEITSLLEHTVKGTETLVEITAYCLMPNHFHLLLRQSIDSGISTFLSNVLNGYTRYFNLKNERKGPLWIGRTKNVLILNDAHLWEESRYIHRNPCKAMLVKNPAEWLHSSYREYLGEIPAEDHVCSKSIILDSDIGDYRDFVEGDSTS